MSSHAIAHNEPLHMGAPVPHGKLAMWIFLATEIMFFTALIGTYSILRNGQPTKDEPWPKPHDVHLIEWLGALNTFVLICSSVCIVLAHWTLCRGNAKAAARYVALTFALGCVFLVVKAYEYNSKFQHEIIPGHVYDRVDGPRGVAYMNKVKSDLQHVLEHGAPAEVKEDCTALLAKLELKDSRAQITPTEVGARVKEILHKEPELHLTPIIPYGNLWASCYFAMTGFHALHVIGGLVIFVVILLMAARGKLSHKHESLLELTGLYWHFVDIVWIFLFPFLYLV
jgi:cytochrome c oxidase subunit III